MAGAQFFAAMRKMDAMGERRSSPEPPGKLSDDLKSDEEPSLRAQTTSSLPRSSRPGGLAKRMRGKDETPPSTSQNALVKTDSIEKIVDQDKQAEQAFLASVQAKQPQPVKATTKAKAPLKKSSVGASSPAEKVLEERKTAPTPSKAAKQAKKCNVDKENDPSSEAIVPHSQCKPRSCPPFALADHAHSARTTPSTPPGQRIHLEARQACTETTTGKQATPAFTARLGVGALSDRSLLEGICKS